MLTGGNPANPRQWLRKKDSNLRPSAYGADKLTAAILRIISRAFRPLGEAFTRTPSSGTFLP